MTPTQHAQRYVVRKHKGRSGLSVYEWRVYSLIEGPKTTTI